MAYQNPTVDQYILNGCGRCEFGGTPKCKVHQWTNELILLREIVLESGLTEECKWGVPCYTYQGKNVCIIGAFKEYCALSFMKGSLLKDEDSLLTKPGTNSRHAMYFRFQNQNEILSLKSTIKAYLKEAIEIEKSGQNVGPVQQHELVFPEELLNRFKEDPLFEQAFEALTPGRKRGYIIFFTAAKQSKTREARIDKYTEFIFKGKGMYD